MEFIHKISPNTCSVFANSCYLLCDLSFSFPNSTCCFFLHKITAKKGD